MKRNKNQVFLTDCITKFFRVSKFPEELFEII